MPFIRLVYDGDVKAERKGASWTASPVSLHFQGDRTWWQTKLHSKSEAYRDPIQTLMVSLLYSHYAVESTLTSKLIRLSKNLSTAGLISKK